MKLFLVALFLILLNLATLALKVSVYYETLCPDSMAFIKDQLHHSYKAFGPKFIQLELIPYGFAKTTVNNDTFNFKCQHGPRECYGNKVHGCVIDAQAIRVSESFVDCSETNEDPAAVNTLRSCAELHYISWPSIEQCLASGRADTILARNGNKTALLQPSFIPAIVFNDTFNGEDSKQAQTDLKAVICKYLDNKPSQCAKAADFSVVML